MLPKLKLQLLWAAVFVCSLCSCHVPHNKTAEDYAALTNIAQPRRVALRIVYQQYETGLTAIDPCVVELQLAYINEFFKPLNAVFFVESTEYIAYKNSYTREMVADDATKHPNVLSIYYLTSYSPAALRYHNGKLEGLSGFSAFPWGERAHGVMLFCATATHLTLAHEIGHYFGLYHTFDGLTDMVDDTLHTDDPNYDNFMNYTQTSVRSITKGQIVRMNFFLVHYRTAVLR